MNQINDIPSSVTNAGLDFNFAVWTAHTRVTLCNSTWDMSYNDIVKFPNQAALDKYIDDQDSSSITMDDINYAPVNRPITINIPFNRAYKYNYLRASNYAQPVPGGDEARSFYYFILDVAYISPNTTQLVIQLDVWQTFGYGITFGTGYVERGHIGVAEANDLVNGGREFLAVPEGLDTGGEYQVARTYRRSIASAETGSYGIIIMATADLISSGGTVDDPHLVTGSGAIIEKTPQGASFYYFDRPEYFSQWLDSKSEMPWVTQSIISVMAVPSLTRYGYQFPSEPGNRIVALPSIDILQPNEWNAISDFRHNSAVTNIIPIRYRHLHKFLMSPYMMFELTTYTGAPLMLKPEMFGIDIRIDEYFSMVPPAIRLMFMPYQYGANDPSADVAEDMSNVGEYFDVATGITNFPTFSITNNSYIAYMASNAHSIQFSYNNADWSQQKALRGNELSANQASAGIDLSYRQNAIANNQANQMTTQANTMAGINAISSGLNTVGGMAIGAIGGPIGAAGFASGAMNLANTGMNYSATVNNNNMTNKINTVARNSSQDANASNAAYMRDSNKEFADYSTRGDYAQAIAGIQAKVQDTRLSQPSVSGQVGGDAFNLTKMGWQLHLKVKGLTPGAMVNVGEFWLRYGYAIQRWVTMPASLMTMEKFTYWKMREIYVTRWNCPETFKNTIRGIFQKGVTVWTDPSNIGRTDIGDNAPVVKSYMPVHN